CAQNRFDPAGANGAGRIGNGDDASLRSRDSRPPKFGQRRPPGVTKKSNIRVTRDQHFDYGFLTTITDDNLDRAAMTLGSERSEQLVEIIKRIGRRDHDGKLRQFVIVHVPSAQSIKIRLPRPPTSSAERETKSATRVGISRRAVFSQIRAAQSGKTVARERRAKATDTLRV